MEEVISPEGKVTGPRGASAHKRWEPKQWLPIYEAIVALSCTGLSNEEVGKRFGYGKQQVSNILNTPQGKKLKELIANRIRDMNLLTLEDRMAFMQKNALGNIDKVLADEDGTIIQRAPLALFDRSLAFLKSSGALKGDQPIPPASNPLVGNAKTVNVLMAPLSQEANQLLRDGLSKAKEVEVIHGNILPAATSG
jgi:hypothetical protein